MLPTLLRLSVRICKEALVMAKRNSRRYASGWSILFLLLLLFSVAVSAQAEIVTEAWRGGTVNLPYSVSVNLTNGSCWAASYGYSEVLHLDPNGAQLWRGGGFDGPYAVSANSADNSCWVADYFNARVVHLDPNGAQMWQGGTFSGPVSVSVDPGDGSCWVSDYGGNKVVRLDPNGATLGTATGFNTPRSVSVNSSDGSCWVADFSNHQVVHLDPNGAQLWRGGTFSFPMSVSVNSSDGSCWVADYGNSQVVHLDPNGAELWRGSGFSGPLAVSVNSADGSCWVADSGNNQVVHLAANGAQLWRGGSFAAPVSVSANGNDGSCWVADMNNHAIVHLAITSAVPMAPSNLTATPISEQQINLAWTEISGDESGFKIERKTGSDGTWSEIATVAADVTTYKSKELSAATRYYYRVRAWNSAGDSEYSNEANATTFALPTPSGLTATPISTTRIDLAWTDTSTGETGFKIERRIGSGTWSQIDTVGADVTTYQSTGLTANTTYSYRVRAFNASGNSNFSNIDTDTTFAVVEPSGLTATAISDDRIDLAWTDNSSDETGFRIERRLGNGDWVEITTVGAGVVSYQDSGLSMGTPYSYRVRAYNAIGYSAYSNEASATTTTSVPPATPTPTSPSGSSTNTTPTFTFSAVSGATDYRIYLWSQATGTGSLSPWRTAAEVGAPYGIGSGSITWASALPLGSYTWYVQARNVVGASVWSGYLPFAVVAVGTPPAAPTPVSPSGFGISQTPTFTFGAVSGATGYRIYLWDHATGTGVLSRWYTASEVGAPSGTGNGSIVWTTTLAVGSYTWYVQARNDSGASAWSSFMGFSVVNGILPSIPTPISPSGSGISSTPTFTFGAVSGATHYRMYVWSKNTGACTVSPWYTAAEVGAPDGTGNGSIAWWSTALNPGLYTWYIQAQNDAGVTSWSNYLIFTVQ